MFTVLVVTLVNLSTIQVGNCGFSFARAGRWVRNGVRCTVELGKLAGSFRGRGMLGGVARSFRGKGVRKVVKFGNSKGAMVFGYVYKFLRPRDNAILMKKGRVKGRLSFPSSMNVVVRGPNFFLSLDNFTGLGELTSLGRHVSSSSIETAVHTLKLSPLSGGGMKRCSLKVHRHLNVTRTVVRSPRLLVLSRPFGNLSGRKTKRIYRLLQKLGRQKGAVLVTTRGVLRVR